MKKICFLLLLLFFLVGCGFERKGVEGKKTSVRNSNPVEQSYEDEVEFILDETEMKALIYNNSGSLVNLVTSEVEFWIKNSDKWELLQQNKPAFIMEQGIENQSIGEYDFSYISDYLNSLDDRKRRMKVIFYYKIETKGNQIFQKEMIVEYN